MKTVTTTSLFTPLLILLLLESLPSIKAEPPSSDDSNTATPATNISPTVATIWIVFVGVFFLSGFLYVALRWIIDAGCCGFTSGGTSLGGGGPQRGPLAVQLQPIPTYFYKDLKMHRRVGGGELECAVCLCEFQDHEALRQLPKCSHVFHPHCVDPWLLSQVTCPVCRAVLLSSSESEASDDPPHHVITVDRNSPLRPALNNGRPSDPDLTTEDSTVDRDEPFTLTLPAERGSKCHMAVTKSEEREKRLTSEDFVVRSSASEPSE